MQEVLYIIGASYHRVKFVIITMMHTVFIGVHVEYMIWKRKCIYMEIKVNYQHIQLTKLNYSNMTLCQPPPIL